MNRSFRNVGIAVFLLVAMFCQVTWALAGTTGGLSGTVVSAENGSPIAGAKVTASSPSQVATSTTDAAGRFTFLSLAPDTYTVSVTKTGFADISQPGQTVFADSTATLSVSMQPAMKTIARTTSTTAGSLVRAGTTSDVYAVNAATQERVSGLGGGGGLNSAYSAIATVPGAYVAGNQGGYYQTVHIRGGDFDQVGYEFDGVPINRSFDNYPSGSASSLGEQEVQVYTGASPANSESQGLAGYINQVIKTGTYPGFATLGGGIGTPTFYHHLYAEAGGATPNRLFSYYIGLGGYNQGDRYVDNTNGSSYDGWLGVPVAQNANGTWQLGSTNYLLPATISVRDSVMNFHFALPHHHDQGRDDIQLLYDGESINNAFYQSPADTVGIANYNAGNWGSYGQPSFIDGYAWNCGVGVDLASLANPSSCVGAYTYPNHGSTNRLVNVPDLPNSCPSETASGTPCAFISPFARDTSWNDQQIFKAQYQKNMGSDAYLRVYGYTYYSDWLLDGPTSTYDNIAPGGTGAGATAPDYELTSHTRGISATLAKQFSNNLVSLQGSYTTANAVRDNEEQMLNSISSKLFVDAVLVNAADPFSGYCYNAGSAAPVTCNPLIARKKPVNATSSLSWDDIAKGTSASTTGLTCTDPNTPSTACEYMVAENGQYGAYNNVTPKFTSWSLTDEWRPNDKFLVNAGLRLDDYKFVGQNTYMGPVRQMWYNAYNLDTCVGANGAPVDVSTLGIAPGACASQGLKQANLSNDVGQPVEQFNIFQPRLAFTYTQSPNTVWRASIGKYAQPANTAFEQYNTLELDEPFLFLGANFLQYGRTSPSASVRPPTSTNMDLSLEHHIRGTDMSFKLTPFFRHTQDQVQNFFLNQATGFISGLNVGSQSSRGVEFQFQKGDFSRNGLSGLFSFAYTYSTIKYAPLSNGTTIIDPLNAQIAMYNAYTSACAAGGALAGKSQYGQPLCGTTEGGKAAAPCYNAAGPDASCAPGDWGNPYWNAPGQAFINPGQEFPTYDIFPAAIGSSASAYGAPYVATLVLNYKHDKWSVTPSLQFQGGTRYGAPNTTPGLAPDTCTGILAGQNPTTDPRYVFGGGNLGSASPDNATCDDTTLSIPDPFTKTFDPLGSFVQPSQMMMNLQLSYDVSPRISLIGTFANLMNTCFGGSKTAWTVTDHNICSYGVVAGGLIPPIVPNGGTAYNPGQTIQPFQMYPYQGALGPFDISGLNTTAKNPLQFFIEARIKI